MRHQDPLIGRQLVNFRIERLLGRGGMARVYYGWDVKLERPVAIKIIDERYRGDPAYDERFLREARAVAAMQHANILQIYQAGEEEGISYYAMEYIRGLDVGQLIRKYAASGERMPYADVVRIGRAVARALDYAHQRGIIHRDVKPSNVLVADDGRVMLTDFGLAMDMAQGTRGEVFGSPLYIPPEQARGSASVVPQSDLYSLAVMLYEMLTGALPFEDDSPAALAFKHVNDPPPSPRQVNPALNQQTEDVLLKALSKNPNERFTTGRMLVDALEDALYAPAEEAMPHTRPMPVEDFDRSFHSHPTPVSRVSIDERVAQHLEERPPVMEASVWERNPDATLPSLMRRPTPGFGWGRMLRVWLTCGVIQLLCAISLVVVLEFALAQAGDGTQDDDTIPATQPAGGVTFPEVSSLPTPAVTAAPTTPADEISYPMQPVVELLIATRKDESLVLMNAGSSELALGDLAILSPTGEVFGPEWNVEALMPGECVAVEQENGNPRLPENVECLVVGERLTRSGREKFWTVDFEVLYDGRQAGVCEKRAEACQVRFQPFP
jgi:serine/threonine protein kinase